MDENNPLGLDFTTPINPLEALSGLAQNVQRNVSSGLKFINGAVRHVPTFLTEVRESFTPEQQPEQTEFDRKVAISPTNVGRIENQLSDTIASSIESTGDFLGVPRSISTPVAGAVASIATPGVGDIKLAFGAGSVALTGAVTATNPRILRTVGGSPGINVKRGGARQKFSTQGEFNVTQPAKIDAARNAVDDAKLILQTIEEANPGVKPGVLRQTIPEYKAAQKALADKMPKVSSEESNLLAPGPGRELAYPRTKPRAKEVKLDFLAKSLKENPKQVTEQIDLHHKFPKGISAAFFNRGRDFIQKGLMTYDELVDMAKRAQKLGLEPGDVESDLLPMFKTPHDSFHAEMRAQGSNQFPGENLEISKTKLTQKLRAVKTKKDLNALWDEMLSDDVKYLYETAEVWQPLDKTIKEVSPKFTGKAKSK